MVDINPSLSPSRHSHLQIFCVLGNRNIYMNIYMSILTIFSPFYVKEEVDGLCYQDE